jgi:hypothetical protein
MEHYLIEVTDTFAGEANYSWVNRFKIGAKSRTAAIRKFSKSEGFTGTLRKDYDGCDTIRYNVQNACICVFVTYEALGEFNDSSFKLID